MERCKHLERAERLEAALRELRGAVYNVLSFNWLDTKDKTGQTAKVGTAFLAMLNAVDRKAGAVLSEQAKDDSSHCWGFQQKGE